MPLYSSPAGAPPPTAASIRAAFKPPIYNPYDKFTKAEFDAWIGDITGALRRALGEEGPVAQTLQRDISEENDDYEENDIVEDSFAEIKARRAAKGKQRATEADEDEFDDQEVEASILVNLSGSEEDEEEDEEDEDEEEDEGEEEPFEGSSRGNGWAYADENDQWSQEENEGSVESDADVASGNPEEPIEISDDEDDEVASPRATTTHRRLQEQEEYDGEEYDEDDGDDGEEEEEEDAEEEEDEGALPSRILRDRDGAVVDYETEGEDSGEGEVEADDEVVEVIDDENEEEFPPLDEQRGSPPAVDIPDPWEGPSTYAEDFYAGGDVPPNANNPHVLPTEEYDDDEFPPQEDEAQLHPVELVDKWSGPRIYAEDYYAGGDMPPEVARTRTPSHLTPNAGTPRTQEDAYDDAIIHETSASHPEASQLGVMKTTVSGTSGHDGSQTFSMPTEPQAKVQVVDDTTSIDDLYLGIGDEPLSVETEIPSPSTSQLQGRQSSQREVVEISDEDDDDPVGPAPLGTSDLDIPVNASYDHEEEDVVSLDDNHESFVEEIDDMFTSGIFSDSYNGVDGAQNGIYYDDMGALYKGEVAYDDVATGAAGFAGITSLVEEHFEPVLPAGTEFDGIPTPSLNLRPTASSGPADEVKFMEALAHMQHDSGSIAQDHTIGPFTHASIPSAQGASGDVQVTTIEQSYTVEELSDGGGVHIPDADDGLEVTTDRGETPAVAFDYTVEEVNTEGRRTEEPDTANLGVELLQEDSTSLEPAQAGERDSRLTDLETPVASSQNAPTAEGDISNPSTLLESTPVTHENGQAPLQSDGATDMILKITVVEDSAPGHSPLRQLRSSVSPIRMFSPGIPMPVSADPNVPDPASVHDTPISSPRPDSPSPNAVDDVDGPSSVESSPSKRGVLSAVPPSLAQYFTQKHSPSGLFTPVSGESSSAASPEAVQSAEGSVVGAEEALARVNQPASLSQATQNVHEVKAPAAAAEDQNGDVSGQRPASHAEAADGVPETKVKTKAEDAGVDADVDADAEGDIDSEYGGSVAAGSTDQAATTKACAEGERTETDAAEVQPQLKDPEAAPAPDELANSDAIVSQVEQGSPPPVNAEETDAANDTQDTEESQSLAVAGSAEVVVTTEEPTIQAPEVKVTKGPTETSEPREPEVEATQTNGEPDAVSPSQDDAPAESPAPTTSAISNELSPPTRNLKRKRVSPAPSTRLTRSRSANTALAQTEVALPPSPSAKRKGKAPAHVPEPPVEESSDSEVDQLDPEPEPSRQSSRASSVLSAASNISFSPSSPTVATHDTTLRPLFHDNGTLIHRHGLHRPPPPPPRALERVRTTSPAPAPAPSEAPPQAQAEAQPAGEDQHESSSSADTPTTNGIVAVDFAVPKAPVPPPIPAAHKPPAVTNSPVTRSNCRFHKISIPREENGARVFFAVPGCSLSNRELMKKQDIVDHGLVTRDDSEGLIADVESLQLSPYVVGFLRQLVGVDLLREQEVYYVRQGDEKIRRQRTRQFKPRLSTIDSISGRNGIPLTVSQRAVKPSPKPVSTSSNASASTSASVARSRVSTRGTPSIISGPSISDREDSDTEKKPAAKRRRRARATAASVDGDVESQASTSVTKLATEKRPTRRSKRLAPDAAAYVPGEESEEHDSEAEVALKKGKGKRGNTRKRTRAADDATEQATEGKAPAKKRKTTATASTPAPPPIDEKPEEQVEEPPSNTNGDSKDSKDS